MSPNVPEAWNLNFCISFRNINFEAQLTFIEKSIPWYSQRAKSLAHEQIHLCTETRERTFFGVYFYFGSLCLNLNQPKRSVQLYLKDIAQKSLLLSFKCYNQFDKVLKLTLWKYSKRVIFPKNVYLPYINSPLGHNFISIKKPPRNTLFELFFLIDHISGLRKFGFQSFQYSDKRRSLSDSRTGYRQIRIISRFMVTIFFLC